MKKFKLTVRVEFFGEVVVRAENEEEAVEIAESSLQANLTDVCSTSDAIEDWDIDMKPDLIEVEL